MSKRAVLCRNGFMRGGKVVLVPNSMERLLSLCRDRLGIADPESMYHEDGKVVESVEEITQDERLYVTFRGEPFEKATGDMSSQWMVFVRETGSGPFVPVPIVGERTSRAEFLLQMASGEFAKDHPPDDFKALLFEEKANSQRALIEEDALIKVGTNISVTWETVDRGDEPRGFGGMRRSMSYQSLNEDQLSDDDLVCLERLRVSRSVDGLSSVLSSSDGDSAELKELSEEFLAPLPSDSAISRQRNASEALAVKARKLDWLDPRVPQSKNQSLRFVPPRRLADGSRRNSYMRRSVSIGSFASESDGSLPRVPSSLSVSSTGSGSDNAVIGSGASSQSPSETGDDFRRISSSVTVDAHLSESWTADPERHHPTAADMLDAGAPGVRSRKSAVKASQAAIEHPEEESPVGSKKDNGIPVKGTSVAAEEPNPFAPEIERKVSGRRGKRRANSVSARPAHDRKPLLRRDSDPDQHMPALGTSDSFASLSTFVPKDREVHSADPERKKSGGEMSLMDFLSSVNDGADVDRSAGSKSTPKKLSKKERKELERLEKAEKKRQKELNRQRELEKAKELERAKELEKGKDPDRTKPEKRVPGARKAGEIISSARSRRNSGLVDSKDDGADMLPLKKQGSYSRATARRSWITGGLINRSMGDIQAHRFIVSANPHEPSEDSDGVDGPSESSTPPLEAEAPKTTLPVVVESDGRSSAADSELNSPVNFQRVKGDFWHDKTRFEHVIVVGDQNPREKKSYSFDFSCPLELSTLRVENMQIAKEEERKQRREHRMSGNYNAAWDGWSESDFASESATGMLANEDDGQSSFENTVAEIKAYRSNENPGGCAAATLSVLENDLAVQFFEAYCISQVAIENLLFWFEAREYEKAPSPEGARSIYIRFIAESSSQRVNIPGESYRRIAERFLSQKFDRELFAEAREIIFKLLAQSIFPGFVKTSFYNSLYLTYMNVKKEGNFASRNTPLYLWAVNGDVEKVLQLLEFGFPANIRNAQFEVPLHAAVQLDNLVVAQYLCRFGADANAPNINGDTPLHFAASADNAKMVKLLLQYKGNPRLLNSSGQSCFDLARRSVRPIFKDYFLKPIIRLTQKGGPDDVWIHWGPEWEVGEESVDREHLEIAMKCNEIYAFIRGGEDYTACIVQLVAMLQLHWVNEEKILKDLRYKGLKAHVKEHRKMDLELLGILKSSKHSDHIEDTDPRETVRSAGYGLGYNFKSEEAAGSREQRVLDILRDMFVVHIWGLDRELRRHFLRKRSNR